MSIWDDEEFTSGVVRRYVAGEGPTEIGRSLGLTRNQVLAKMVRLGHVRKSAAMPRPVSRAPKPKPQMPKGVFVLPFPTPGSGLDKRLMAVTENAAARASGAAETPAEVGARTILTIRPFECRWPHGDPQRDDFTFCGAPAEGPYCAEHARRAFVPSKTKPSELVRSLRRWATA